MNEIQKLLQQAQEAIQRGAPADAVALRFQETTGMSMQAAMEMSSRRPAPQTQAAPDVSPSQRYLSDNPGSAIGDFLTLLGHGASFGLLGNQERVEALRAENPITAGAVELAGGMVVPGGSAAKVTQNVSRRAGSKVAGMAAGMGTAALTGGVGGSVYAASEAEPGQRVEAAQDAFVPAAAASAALPLLGSGATRTLNSARRRGFNGTGHRVSGALSELSGTPGKPLNMLIEGAGSPGRRLDRVRDVFFKTFDQAYGEIEDPRIISELGDMLEAGGQTKAAVRKVMPDVASGDRPPSFSELQALTRALRNKGLDDADVLDNLMSEIIPDYDDARRAYGEASRRFRAIGNGRKAMRGKTKSASDIREFTRGLRPEEADAFREGQVAEVLEQLGDRESATTTLRQMLRAGPAYRDKMSTMFTDQGAFQDFMGLLESEADAAQVARFYREVARWAIAGAGIGGGATIANALMGGN